MISNKYLKLSFYVGLFTLMINGVFANELTNMLKGLGEGVAMIFTGQKFASDAIGSYAIYFLFYSVAIFLSMFFLLKHYLDKVESLKGKVSGIISFFVSFIVTSRMFISINETSISFITPEKFIKNFANLGSFVGYGIFAIFFLVFCVNSFLVLKHNKKNWDLFVLGSGLLVFCKIMTPFFQEKGFMLKVLPQVGFIATVLSFVYWISWIVFFVGLFKGFGGIFSKDPTKSAKDKVKDTAQTAKRLRNVISLLQNDAHDLERIEGLLSSASVDMRAKANMKGMIVGRIRDIQNKVDEVVKLNAGNMLRNTFGGFLFENKAKNVQAKSDTLKEITKGIIDTVSKFEESMGEDVLKDAITYIHQLRMVMNDEIDAIKDEEHLIEDGLAKLESDVSDALKAGLHDESETKSEEVKTEPADTTADVKKLVSEIDGLIGDVEKNKKDLLKDFANLYKTTKDKELVAFIRQFSNINPRNAEHLVLVRNAWNTLKSKY